MEKSLVVAVVDAIVIFVGFLLGKYLAPDWAEAITALLIAFQPPVVYLVAKWLNIETLIRAGVLPPSARK